MAGNHSDLGDDGRGGRDRGGNGSGTARQFQPCLAAIHHKVALALRSLPQNTRKKERE